MEVAGIRMDWIRTAPEGLPVTGGQGWSLGAPYIKEDSKDVCRLLAGAGGRWRQRCTQGQTAGLCGHPSWDGHLLAPVSC